MSYNKTTWNTGDVITAEKLNNIENGIANLASGVFVIHFEQDSDSIVTVESWDEITNAANNNVPLVCQIDNEIIGDCQIVRAETPGEIGLILFNSIQMDFDNGTVYATITRIGIAEEESSIYTDNVYFSANSVPI